MHDLLQDDAQPWAEDDPRVPTASSEWRADQLEIPEADLRAAESALPYGPEAVAEADLYLWFG